MGARFAKWRAIIRITDSLPSSACVTANAYALARYAALCQEQQLVPIVEPEVLMDGFHTIERCEEVTGVVRHAVFHALFEQDVAVEGVLLKPNTVVAGARLATIHLNAINRLPGPKPWKISFSYGRADPALEAWHGRDENLAAGQSAFYRRASCNGAASVGKYTDEMEL